MPGSSASNKRVRITDSADELIVDRSGRVSVKKGGAIELEDGATLTIGGETVHAGTDAGDVPDGGTTGQVLKKASNADFDTEWDDESAGGGAVDSVFGQTGVVPDLSGDVTTSGSSNTILATSGVTAGTYGDASNIPQITVDAKGRVTSVTEIPAAGGGGDPRTNIRGITATTTQLVTDGTIYCNNLVFGPTIFVDLDDSLAVGTIVTVINATTNTSTSVAIRAPLGGDINGDGPIVSLGTNNTGLAIQKLDTLRWVGFGGSGNP